MHLLFVALLALTRPWLVVSDLHVDPFDRGAAVDYRSDTPWTLFDSSVAAMRAADPQAPVVVIAGDFLAHQWSAKARAAGVDPQQAALSTVTRIAHTFDRAFPHAQFLIALGNNDDPCGDYRVSPSSPYLRQLARIWAPMVDRGGVSPDFERDFSLGGFYDARAGGVHAVVLDDVMWSIVYRSCGGPDAAGAQFEWLASLAEQIKNEPAVFVMHIPPGIDPTATLLTHRFVVVPYWSPGARSRFDGLAQRFNVAFYIAGHLHRLDFRIENTVPVLVASSISPIYGNNPSFLTLDVEGARAADYTPYIYDPLQDVWKKAASFDRLFGATEFSRPQLNAVHTRIANDPQLRDRWAWLATGGTDAEGQVLYSWRAFWCAQTQLGRGYIGCAGDERRVALVVGGVAAVAVVVVVAAVWYSRRRRWKQKRNGA